MIIIRMIPCLNKFKWSRSENISERPPIKLLRKIAILSARKITKSLCMQRINKQIKNLYINIKYFMHFA